MNAEFHYHIVGILAKKAGLDRKSVDIIAYASQFVDDNSIIYNITSKENNEEVYHNYI